MKKYLLENIKDIPHSTGVYQFIDKHNNILYIGKAKDLRKRIFSYFQNRSTLELKIRNMLEAAKSLQLITLSSEFEALLLEAKLIRNYQPKYNSIWKDDKHYIYIKITKEEFPRILFARKQDSKDYYFGPFPSAKTVREILSFLRNIFPYCTQSRRFKKTCFYTHLGLCNPCPGQIVSLGENDYQMAKKQYYLNIKQIKDLLSGKINKVRNYLISLMQDYSSNLDYEKAAIYRNKLNKLNHLVTSYQPRHLDLNDHVFLESGWATERTELINILRKYFSDFIKLKKIECYDVSNIQGKHATGAMVTFINGLPTKNLYRRFKIHSKSTPNDFAMLSEILERRFSHKEWTFPQLIILDGGKPQLTAARKIISGFGIFLPVIGLAKREEEIIIPQNNHFINLKLPLNSYALRLIQRMRDESHRFSHKYHTLLRLKYLVSEVEKKY